MKVFLPFFICLALLPTVPSTAQITPAEYQKMWAANTLAYNAQTAEADKKKADAIITAMEKKYPADASVMLNRGVYYYWFLNDDNKALTHFSKAIQKKPTYNLAYLYRAKVLARKGIYEKAIADLSFVLQTDSLNLEALKERGDYAFAIKQYDSALIDYQKLMQLKPNHADVENDVANTLVELGKISLAEAVYTNALNVPNVDSARVCANYGRFLLGQKRYATALANYENAIRLAPQKLTADDYNNAGIAAYKEKNYYRAKPLFTAAIAANPSNVNYYDNLANVGIDDNDMALVLENAMQMMVLDANNAKANMLLYIGLKKSGRNENTAETYRSRALQLEKDGQTTVAIPDSMLFVLPKAEAARKQQQSSARFVAALANYKTDFLAIPESNWTISITDTFKAGDKPLDIAKSGEVFVVQGEGSLQIKHNGKNATSNHFSKKGLAKMNNDVLFASDFSIGPNDGSASAGLMVTTTGGSNAINYYFVVNPVKQRIFVGFLQKGKFGVFHGWKDSVLGKLPASGEPLSLKVVSKNLEIAFIVNGNVVKLLPLIRFREINELAQVAFHFEGDAKVNLTSLSAGYSNYDMTASAIDALGWQRDKQAAIEAAKPKPVPSLPFLGTFIVYSSYGGVNFPYLFHIKGNGPVDEQRMFNLLVKTLHDGNFKNYTWKPNQEMSAITKTWDLRDYKYKGTYDTNGNYLYY